MRENSSTVLPVLERLESTLSLLAIACVPGSEKSAPKAYRWATSRVSSVASSVRPTRMPTDPTPNSSGNANVSARASSIRAEPRPLADLTGGCAGNGGRLHDGRRRDGESQRRPIVQQRHHPRPGKTAGRNDYDIAAGEDGDGQHESATRHQHGAFEIEAHAHFAQSSFAQRVAQPRLILGVQHQESASAGANQLAAQRSAGARHLIELVDGGIGHGFRPVLLALPVLVHDGGEAA